MSLRDRINATLGTRSTQLAIESAEGAATWGEIHALAVQIDAFSSGLEIEPMDRIGLVIRNRLAVACALIALLSLGRRVVILNAHLPGQRLRTEIAELQLHAVIACEGDVREFGLQDLARSMDIGLVTLDLPPGPNARLLRAARKRCSRPGVGSPQCLAIEMVTSGTTGTPKRIALRAESLEQATLSEEDVVSDLERYVPAEKRRVPFINFYPLGNIAGLYFLIHASVTGRPTLLLQKFNVGEWVSAVRQFRPPALYIPPAAIRMVMDAHVPPVDLSGALIMRSGNAPLEDGLRTRFEETYGIPVLSHYGATEFCGVVTTWSMDDYHRFGLGKRASLGRARKGIELRTVDAETFAPVSAGKIGLLEVKAERMGATWMRTSDLGRVDEDGFLFIEGRADGAINRGGFKVLPERIASALMRHPSVLEAGVVGIADGRLGEVPAAAIVVKPDSPVPSAEEMNAFARDHLAAYQIPARFAFVDTLPKTLSMKLDRERLRALFKQLGETGLGTSFQPLPETQALVDRERKILPSLIRAINLKRD